MQKIALLLAFSLLPSFLIGQTIKEAQKADKKINKKLLPEEKIILNIFKKNIENYNWSELQVLFLEEHYERQMNMYLTDDFMFGHLGEVGERDTLAIQRLYLCETLRLKIIQEEMEGNAILGKDDLEQIESVFLLDTKLNGDYKTVSFIMFSNDGKQHLGHFMLVDTLNGLRIVGPMG